MTPDHFQEFLATVLEEAEERTVEETQWTCVA